MKRIEELLDEGFIGDLVRVEFQGCFTHWPRLWQKRLDNIKGNKVVFVRGGYSLYSNDSKRLFGDIEDISTFIEYPANPQISEESSITREW